MLSYILYGVNVVSAAILTSQVQSAMEGQKLVEVLIQLKQAEIKEMSPIEKQKASELEIDSYAKNLVLRLKRHAQSTAKNVQSLLDERVNNGDIKLYRFYEISNTFAVEAPIDLIYELSRFSEVKEISSNDPILMVNAVKSEGSNQQEWTSEESHWSLNYINATNLPKYIYKAAAELRYANADTGAQFDHPALRNNYLGLKENGEIDHNYSWWDSSTGIYNSTRHKCKPKTKVPCDDFGHGTHTLGTAIGSINLGVSPNSKWMSCKNMFDGTGTPESFLGCLNFFLAPTDLNGQNANSTLRPHVINNSYLCRDKECSETTFSYMFKALKSSGIFITVAVGNDGEEGCGTINLAPAIDPNAFNVAATDYNSNKRSNLSSLGPIKGLNKHAIDIAAPGVNITSSVYNSKYEAHDGSSMAAPHVSGAVLLITGACPHLTRKVDKIIDLLHLSATPILPQLQCGNDTPTSIPNNEVGYGMLNVGRAIELCQLFA